MANTQYLTSANKMNPGNNLRGGNQTANNFYSHEQDYNGNKPKNRNNDSGGRDRNKERGGKDSPNDNSGNKMFSNKQQKHMTELDKQIQRTEGEIINIQKNMEK